MATNAEVAERLGVSHSTVSRMRTGKRVGSPAVLVRIAEKYEIPLEEVMAAAVAARSGKPAKWTMLMKRVTA
jgi:transcriptional regulator with XRE-family HTH domain